jgi:ribosomal protein L17
VLGEGFIQSQIPQLRKLLRSVEDLIDTAKRHHLTNRSLTSAALGSIKIHGEYVADYLDALEMSIDPDVLKAINEGHDQIDRGEFETMEQLSE